MENKRTTVIVGIAVVAVCLVLGYVFLKGMAPVPPTEVSEVVPPRTDDIRLDNLEPGAAVESPLTLKGYARNTWFVGDEGFVVEVFDASDSGLVDEDGEEVLVPIGEARVQKDLSREPEEEFTPFVVTLTFSQPATTLGSLIFTKPQTDAELDEDYKQQFGVGVQFVMSQSATE